LLFPLRFERGKIYGIAGENGAGKTTLFRCIAGMETYQGQITSGMSPLKNHLGFLHEDN
jgi:ABC-2 type transport system ATP-binding protein